jgi:bifunctional DNA-binding transcriptional regulator/antitoxin component of YhaV-PrlF toxin-antitoxin module
MKEVSIIRDRGQLTIPDSIRRRVGWATTNSAVSISVVKPDEIIIRPNQNYVDWDKIWENIRQSRAISGKGHESAASFLEKDRHSR